MSIEKLKGLKGLKGLSSKEYEDWKLEQIKLGNITNDTSFEDQQYVYDNVLYLQKYGPDSFKAYTYDERVSKYKEDILRDAIIEKHAGNPELPNLLNLSLEGMEELMLGFEEDGKQYTYDNLWTLEDRQLNRMYDESKGASPRQKEIFSSHTFTPPGIVVPTAQTMYQGEKNALETKRAINDEVLERIKIRDNERLLEKTKPRASEIEKDLLSQYDNGELSSDTIENEFHLATQYSNYYNAFKNAKELEDYSLEQKIKDIAINRAAKEYLGQQKAHELTDQRIRNYISDTQTGWDWAGGTTKNILVGGVAHMANTFIGYNAMLKELQGEDNLTLYLQGLSSEVDENGNHKELPWWNNPQYWNGVDRFNTFSEAEIKRAEENGGISPYNNITRAGEDLDFWSWNTLNESLKMGKYLWSTALMNYISGVGANFLTSKFGGTFSKSILNPTTVLQNSPKVAQTVNKLANLGVHINAGVPMSASMGVNMFNEVRTSTHDVIQKQIDKEYQDVLKTMSNKDITDLVDKHLQHPTIIKAIEQRVQEYKEQGTYNEGSIRPSDEELRKVATAQIRTSLMQNPTELIEYYEGDIIKQKITDNYKNDFKAADEAATQAYKTQATITAIKEIVNNQLFRSYLFSKGNKLKFSDDVVDNIKVGSNNAFVNTFKIRPSLGMGKQIGGEFADEWFDHHSESFSHGFGLGWFNNVTLGRYNPEHYAMSQSIFANFLSGINEGIKETHEHFWDKEGIYEGLIGAISPITSFTPNVVGTINAVVEKKKKKQIEQALLEAGIKQDVTPVNKHWTQRISQYITNPLINSIAEQYDTYDDIEDAITVRNKVLSENKENLLDISNIIASFKEEENGILTHDLKKAKDGKRNKAFNAIWLLREMENDEIYKKSDIVRQTISKLKAFSEGNVDEETITNFLGQPENKNFGESYAESYAESIDGTPVTKRDLAKSHIQENAKELLKIQENINKFEQQINEYAAGKKLNPLTKKQLIYNLVFNQDTKERLNLLEKEISGNDTHTEEFNPYAEFSSEEGYDATLKEIDEEIKSIEDDIDEIEYELGEDDFEKHKDSPRKSITKKQKKLLKLTLDKLIEERTEALNRRRLIVKTYNDISENPRVLTKEEILKLNPSQRLKMLSSDTRGLYSEEQQKIIKEVVRELAVKDPNFASKIHDSASIFSEKQANFKAYERILDNIDVHDTYVQEEAEKMYMRTLRVIHKKRVADAIKDLKPLSKITEPDSFSSEEEALSYKINNKRDVQNIAMNKRYSSAVLEEAAEELGITDFEDVINIIKLQETANGIIDVKSKDENKKLLKQKVFENTRYASNIKEAMGLLEVALDEETNEDLKKEYETILKSLVQRQYQRNYDITNARKKQKEEEKGRKQKIKDEIDNGNIPEGFKADESKAEEVDIVSDTEDTQDSNLKKQQSDEDTTNINDIENNTTQQSPTLQEQIQSDDASAIYTINTQDVTDEGNSLSKDGILEGLIYPKYDNNSLVSPGPGYLKSNKPEDFTGIKAAFYKYLLDHNINLQEIIDFELNSIIKANPDTQVHFMMVEQNNGSLSDIVFNVIKYTDDVKKHHKEERGGVIYANGEPWLIIGHSYSTKHSFAKEFVQNLKIKRNNYLKNSKKEHTGLRYYVSNDYTYVNEIGSGRRVRKLETDENVEHRKISELLYDSNGEYNEKRNPNHLGNKNDKRKGYSNLKWIIQKSNDYIPIGVRDVSQIIPLSAPSDNKGAVFLLIPTVNGKLLPVYIKPTMYTEMLETSLGEKIKQVLTDLSNPDLEIRKIKKDQLRQYLVLTDKDNIKIGNNTLTVVKEGIEIGSFPLDKNFDLRSFLLTVETLNPRINVTKSVLEDPTLTALYDESGALTTDIAYLHTVNGSFTTYEIKDGKPVIIEGVENKTVERQSSSVTKNRRVTYLGTQYRKSNNTWIDENDNVVTETSLIKEIAYQELIFNKEPDSVLSNGDSYYIINDDVNNPVVITKQMKDGKIIEHNKEESIDKINFINKLNEAERQRLEAETELIDLTDDSSSTTTDSKPTSENNIETSVEVKEKVNTNTETTVSPTSINTETDLNVAGKISSKNLVNTNNFTTFEELIKIIPVRKQIKEVFKEKNWTWTNNSKELVEFLISKNVSVEGITDFDNWLKLLNECK